MSDTPIVRLIRAVDAVLRAELDKVEVHPCDDHDDAVRANGMTEELRNLYKTRHLLF